MAKVEFKIWRGDESGGEYQDYETEITEGMVVLDAVYAPEVTRLLADTAARGGRPIGGKWMLVYQAVEQLERWTASLEPAPSTAELEDVTATMAKAFDDVVS